MAPPPTLKELVGSAAREVTQLDSRVWRTLRGLTRPGVLARQWREGTGGDVLPPIRLYLVASALYFLAGADPNYQALIRESLTAALSPDRIHGLDLGQLRMAVEVRMTGWLSVARVLTLLPAGVALALLHPAGKPRLAPALVLAMHWFTVAFLLSVLISVVTGIAALLGVPVGERGMFGIAIVERVILLVWIVVAILRGLGSSPWIAIAVGASIWFLDQALMALSFGIVTGIFLELLEF